MKTIVSLMFGLVFLGAGCLSERPQTRPEDLIYPTSTSQATEPVAPSPAPEIKPETITKSETKKTTMIAILHTSKGDVTISLNEATPKTVDNFVTLAKKGFYDNTKFHRVIDGFMNQGGDPLSKDDSKKSMWGTGGPGYKFADEIMPNNKNDIGTISMANAGPNTNGSQFFLNVAANNFLDSKHTVFGKVTDGMDVVTAINSVATDGSDKPLVPVVIKSITLK